MICLVYFLGCALIGTTSALKLPSYIKTCKRSDSNFDECVAEKLKLAIPSIVKGDKNYKAPPLEPLHLPQIKVDTGANLALQFNDLVVTGLGSSSSFHNIKFDLANNKASFQLHMDNFNFVGTYDISGKILVLPITGTGKANITFVGGTYDYECNWNLIKKDGEEFVKVDKSSLTMKLTKAFFDFDNLFGDKNLSDNMNNVLNESWEAVIDEIGGGIAHTIGIVVTEIFKNYFENIPYSQIFPE